MSFEKKDMLRNSHHDLWEKNGKNKRDIYLDINDTIRDILEILSWYTHQKLLLKYK